MNALAEIHYLQDPRAKLCRAIAAEQRADELVMALQHAVSGQPHWRLEARLLLDEIYRGLMREPRQ